MARFPDNDAGTLTIKSRSREEATSPLPDQGADDVEVASPTEDRTAAVVRRDERGDRKLKDQFEAYDEASNGTGRAHAAIVARMEAAARISTMLGRLGASCGQAKMAADLELLKRELARCHEVLGRLPTEGNFLSILVLVELELGNKSWREITKQEVGALKSAIDFGLQDAPVTFDEFNRTFHTLHAEGWTAGPVLDLGDVEDTPDDEEEPADE